MEPLPNRAFAAYRAVLRELPRRRLASPSTPLHQRIREVFRASSSTTDPDERDVRIQEAEQLAQYARAQRTYAALLERYNPGMSMDEEQRIRLTARRVGLDLPVQQGEEEGSGRKE